MCFYLVYLVFANGVIMYLLYIVSRLMRGIQLGFINNCKESSVLGVCVHSFKYGGTACEKIKTHFKIKNLLKKVSTAYKYQVSKIS